MSYVYWCAIVAVYFDNYPCAYRLSFPSLVLDIVQLVDLSILQQVPKFPRLYRQVLWLYALVLTVFLSWVSRSSRSLMF